MPKTVPAAAEWLLREGDSERGVPLSERILIDDEYWRFDSEQISVDAGLRVYLHSADVRRPVTLTPRQSDSEIWLAANVAIRGEVSLATPDGSTATIDEARSVMFRPALREASYSPAPGRMLKLAGYALHADRIARIFGGALPAPLRPLIERGLETSVILTTPVSTRIRRLARSLFTQRLNGPLRAIYLEGVVLQLFALQAAGHNALPHAHAATLAPKQRRAIEAAREYLISDMRNPPTLGALAAAAEMSEKALNAGFQALYGTTVFETLRDERLEHARLLLKTDALPVKTIAFRVGYNHVTNFITAFARRYGAPPRQYVRELSAAAE